MDRPASKSTTVIAYNTEVAPSTKAQIAHTRLVFIVYTSYNPEKRRRTDIGKLLDKRT